MVAALKARQVLYGNNYVEGGYLSIYQLSKNLNQHDPTEIDQSVLEINASVDLTSEKVDYDRITFDEGQNTLALCCYRYLDFDDKPKTIKIMRLVHIEVYFWGKIQTLHIEGYEKQSDQEKSRLYFEGKKDPE